MVLAVHVGNFFLWLSPFYKSFFIKSEPSNSWELFYLREVEVVAPIRKSSFNIRIIERSITVLNYLIVFNNLYYMAYLFMGHALFHMFVSHVFSTYNGAEKKT